MKIALVTDAWEPQVNGVVRTLKSTAAELHALGHRVEFITPLEFRTLPCPTYPDIRLSLFPGAQVTRRLAEFDPEAIHISTEGPLGLAARRFALAREMPFTTAYHTRFPEYIRARSGIPLSWSYAFLRWFHRLSSAVMAPTVVVKEDLDAWGFRNVVLWSRGVDLDIFRPMKSKRLDTQPPIYLYVGRVAVDDILETSDVFRRGLRYGDTLVRFAGRDIGTANALKNILGVFPRGWRVPLVYRRDGQTFEADVRLPGLHDEAQLIRRGYEFNYPMLLVPAAAEVSASYFAVAQPNVVLEVRHHSSASNLE